MRRPVGEAEQWRGILAGPLFLGEIRRAARPVCGNKKPDPGTGSGLHWGKGSRMGRQLIPFCHRRR
ncbi:hypothetical protein AERO9A_330067 [Aeromonas salmonicida]|nr:hypothetical protein AERO9A_330067 [Aeromonas salmonicida]